MFKAELISQGGTVQSRCEFGLIYGTLGTQWHLRRSLLPAGAWLVDEAGCLEVTIYELDVWLDEDGWGWSLLIDFGKNQEDWEKNWMRLEVLSSNRMRLDRFTSQTEASAKDVPSAVLPTGPEMPPWAQGLETQRLCHLHPTILGLPNLKGAGPHL